VLEKTSKCEPICHLVMKPTCPRSAVHIDIVEAIELLNLLVAPKQRVKKVEADQLPEKLLLVNAFTGALVREIATDEVLCIGKMLKRLHCLKLD